MRGSWWRRSLINTCSRILLLEVSGVAHAEAGRVINSEKKVLRWRQNRSANSICATWICSVHLPCANCHYSAVGAAAAAVLPKMMMMMVVLVAIEESRTLMGGYDGTRATKLTPLNSDNCETRASDRRSFDLYRVHARCPRECRAGGTDGALTTGVGRRALVWHVKKPVIARGICLQDHTQVSWAHTAASVKYRFVTCSADLLLPRQSYDQRLSAANSILKWTQNRLLISKRLMGL